MSTHKLHRASALRQRGLTMVEILVAVTISLVLLAGIMQIFVGSKQSYRVQEAMARVQENARFATEFIARDIRMADFWGCAGAANFNSTLNPAGAGFIDFFQGGIGGTENTGLNGADSLSLRGTVATNAFVEAPFMPTTSAVLRVTPGNGLQNGDIAMVSDCQVGDIFQVTSMNADTSGIVAHNAGGAALPGNSTSNLSKLYNSDAQIYRVQQVTYSIAPGASGAPALFRSVNGNAPVEVIEGVENMQLSYGVDLNGDGAADSYALLGAIADMNTVVSVRMELLFQSLENNVATQWQTIQFNGAPRVTRDMRLRQVFSTVVAMRNRIQ